MAKKANAPRPQGPARAPPIPNKELIQRMNFLHQASALLSSAIYNPAAAGVSQSDSTTAATAAKAKEKQKETNKLANSTQLLDTQPPPVASTFAWTASVPPPPHLYSDLWAGPPTGLAYSYPHYALDPYAHDPYWEGLYAEEEYMGWSSGDSDNMLSYVDRHRVYDAKAAERQRLQDLQTWKSSRAKGAQETPKQKRARTWCDQGLSDEQIKVRERRIEQRQARRAAKAKLPPLVVGHVGHADGKSKENAQKSKEDTQVSALEFLMTKPAWREPSGGLTMGAKNMDKLKQKSKLVHPSQLENRNLSNHYVADIRSIAKKSVMRIDPNVKRTMCRNCNALLIPGITATVRVKPSKTHVHTISTRCTACNVVRQIPAPPILASESAPGEQAQESASNASLYDVDMHHDQPTSSVSQARDATTSISSSRTLSEEGITVDADITSVQTTNAGGPGNEPSESNVNVPADTKKRKHGKGLSSKSRKNKRKHLDPIVPGTKGQYARLRFHEWPEHAVTKVSST